MILHDPAGQLAPAKAAAVRTDQIPSLFPFCGEGQTVQVIPYLAAFCIQTDCMDHILRLQCKGQGVRWLKAVLFYGSQMQAGTQHLQSAKGRRLLRSQIKLFSKAQIDPGKLQTQIFPRKCGKLCIILFSQSLFPVPAACPFGRRLLSLLFCHCLFFRSGGCSSFFQHRHKMPLSPEPVRPEPHGMLQFKG